MIIVMMVSGEKSIEVNANKFIVEFFKQEFKRNTRIESEIPKCTIEIKEEMFILFQNESPIIFMPYAAEDKATDQQKKAMMSFGNAVELCL